MSPRASLPGADELFRNTSEKVVEEKTPEPESTSQQITTAPSPQVVQSPPVQTPAQPVRDFSGPVEPASVPSRSETTKAPRHDEKITFYCTAEDLVRLERARLGLRAEHKVATDRGKIVRAALAEILDDFEARGGNSSLVRRLQQP